MFVVIGLLILWRTAHRGHLLWSNKLFVGTLLLGWGLFNTVEGIVDHEILGIHHVNEHYTEGGRIVFDLARLHRLGSDDARRRVAATASRKARDEGHGMTIIVARIGPWFVLS